MTEVHAIVPDDIDDPARPSGGNTYDRRVLRELPALGWTVREHAVGAGALGATVAALPDGAIALLDGLLASDAPEVLVPHARRLRQVVLLHMPLGHERERAVLAAARAVVTTSAWAGRHIGSGRVRVAEPGVDAAPLAPGSEGGGALLCVAALTPGKGHDVLLDGLAATADLPWHCACVGSVQRDPAWAERIRRRVAGDGLRHRVRLSGPRTGAALDREYAAADLLVLASRSESYGMVVTEALARGLPVLAADAGGVREALGHAGDGTRPGMLVPPGDSDALAASLRAWLSDPARRAGLRRAARDRRASLRGWASTAAVIAAALAEAAA